MKAGDVISYIDMSLIEGANLQRGMNYRLHPDYSVVLMSLRVGAPYADRIEDNGQVLIYEGHDAAQVKGGLNPKTIDQPINNPSGSLTPNGLFLKAVEDYKNGKCSSELVRVYEKIRSGIWAYNGIFYLVDAWQESAEKRKVFKFKLELADDNGDSSKVGLLNIDHNRIIPSHVKVEVWRRDRCRCVVCGSTDNLHFDHIIPYSKGGSSLVAENIQLLCVRHNLEKRDKIQ